MDAKNRVQRSTKEPARAETLFQPTAEQEPVGNKRVWEKFAKPRGWALRWDGFALSEIRKRHREIE